MLKIYKKLLNETLHEVDTIENNTWIDLVKPTEDEIKRVCEEAHISDVFIRGMLDEEEQAHVDKEENQQLIVVDVPVLEAKKQEVMIYTMPLGIILVKNKAKEYLITVSLEECPLLKDVKNGRVREFYTNKKSRFAIQLMLLVSQQYIKNLKRLDKETEKIEAKLHRDTENKSLLQLLSLQKSLVYVSAALSSNQAVLERLMTGNYITLFEEDMAILDDTIIENKQAIEMAKIYTGIINGMTDAFASIISNNLNSIMKLLAGLTIVISIPTMISSFMGMNVSLGEIATNPYSFIIILVLAVIISIVVAFFLKRKNML